MPKSFLTYTNNFENILNTLEKHNFNFPIVLKPIYGGYGNGVIKINNINELSNIFEVLNSYNINKDNRNNTNNEIFIQQYINFKHDIRAFVINNKVACAMERIPQNNNWKGNYSQGAKIKKFNLSDKCEKLILKCSKKLNCNIVGVDILIDENNNNYILEMNITPQFKGIMNFINIPNEILKYINNINNKLIQSMK